MESEYLSCIIIHTVVMEPSVRWYCCSLPMCEIRISFYESRSLGEAVDTTFAGLGNIAADELYCFVNVLSFLPAGRQTARWVDFPRDNFVVSFLLFISSEVGSHKVVWVTLSIKEVNRLWLGSRTVREPIVSVLCRLRLEYLRPGWCFMVTIWLIVHFKSV